MKLFKCLFLVFALFFFAACDNGVKRVVPVDGNGEESVSDEDAADDEDVSDSSVDPSAPDSDTTETSDDSGDSGETADEDAAEISGDADSADSSDDADGETPDNGDTQGDKYCSAVFNGESSKIEIPANDALNLAYETWTIEAWIKQAEEDLTSNNVPIVRKGTDAKTPVYLLTGYKKQQQWGSETLTDGLTGYVSYSYTSETGGGYPGGGWNQGSQSAYVQPSASNVTYSADWSHIAMVHVQMQETDDSTPWSPQEKTVTKLLLFLNGTQVASGNYNDGTITVNTNDEPLVIGANVNSNFFFKGLMDSVKISNTAKYTADFEPSKLSADDSTVAFWDFSGDANDASANALNGTGTDITYSTDCME